MANEIHGILFANVEPVSGATYQQDAVGEEFFLDNVVIPIYDVMAKVVKLNSTHYYSYGNLVSC